MRVAQKFAGYSLAEADNLRKACGKKIRALIARPSARSSSPAAWRTGYGADARHRAVRHHRALRRLRLQQVPLLRLRPRRLPDGLAEGPLPGRVPRRPAHRRSRTTRTRRRSTWPSAGRMGIEVLVPDVNRSLAEFAPDCSRRRGRRRGRRPGHRLRPGRGAQRGRGPGRADRGRARRPTARSPTSTTSASGSTRSVLNKRTMESLIKAGAFDSLGHPRQGLCLVFEEIVDRTARPPPRARRSASSSLFAALRGRRRGPDHRLRRRPRSPSPTPSSTRPSAWPSRRRCSAST